MNEAMIALLSRPAVAEMATPLEQVALLLAEEQKAQAAANATKYKGMIHPLFYFLILIRNI